MRKDATERDHQVAQCRCRTAVSGWVVSGVVRELLHYILTLLQS